MTKINRPANLIAYDTVARQDATASGVHEPFKLIRIRTVLYAVLIVLVSAIMLFAFSNRSTSDISVQRDRAALFTRLSDGGVRNGFTVKILNKAHEPRTFILGVKGLRNAKLSILGLPTTTAPEIVVPTDDLRELRVFVSVAGDSMAQLTPPTTPFSFVIVDRASGTTIERATVMQSPTR